MPPFQDFGFFVHNNPEATAQELRAPRVELQHTEKAFSNSFGHLLQVNINTNTLISQQNIIICIKLEYKQKYAYGRVFILKWNGHSKIFYDMVCE